jgi:hypothetical protein
MDQLIRSQMEQLEKFRLSIVRQVHIRDQFLASAARAHPPPPPPPPPPHPTSSSGPSTQHQSSMNKSRLTRDREMDRDRDRQWDRDEVILKYIEDGVDFGDGFGFEMSADNGRGGEGGSSTRSMRAHPVTANPLPRPRISPTPTNTTGISSVAGATRHIVMPPPSYESSYLHHLHETSAAGGSGGGGGGSSVNSSISSHRRRASPSSSTPGATAGGAGAMAVRRRDSSGSVHSSDGGGGFEPLDLPHDPSSAERASGASSNGAACDPTTVSRHRSELYMVSAMRSHMNMHRELLQFNSQYTTPVSTEGEGEGEGGGGVLISRVSHGPSPANVAATSPEDFHSVVEPSEAEAWQSFTDPFRDPAPAGSTTAPTDPSDDLQLLCEDDLDSSLFDFLF